MALRRTYEPYLQHELLPQFADRLTSLDLSFSEYWGALPGYFDGKIDDTPLVFPNLKSLALSQFIIAHHDHFDWVLAQTSLTSLHMDQCHILSFIRYGGYTDAPDWGVRTHDWEHLPPSSYGFTYGNENLYRFSGTWETVFDRIRRELPELVDFCFKNDWTETHDEVALDRYILFDHGLCPSPWIGAERSGLLDFGYLRGHTPMLPDGSYEGYRELSRARITGEGDGRALKELVGVVEGRQGRYRGVYR